MGNDDCRCDACLECLERTTDDLVSRLKKEHLLKFPDDLDDMWNLLVRDAEGKNGS